VKERLRAILERIDDASLRERVLVFLAAVAFLALVANEALFEPLEARNRAARGGVQAQEEELARLRGQLQRAFGEGGVQAERTLRARIAGLREEIAALDRRVAEAERAFTAPERMRTVLERLLEPRPQLALVEFRTLPVELLVEEEKGVRARIYRHGVEFALRGTYADLYGYLAAIETLPTRLYWGRVELQAQDYPRHTLRVRLYTISFDRTWLTV